MVLKSEDNGEWANNVYHTSRCAKETLHEQAMPVRSMYNMASVRAWKTREQTVNRQDRNRQRMASVRASEMRERTVKRQDRNKRRIAGMRASETRELTAIREEQDRAHKATTRA